MISKTQIFVALTVAAALATYFLGGGVHDALLVGVAVGAVCLLLAYRGPIVKFIGEVRVELGKCAWPWDPNQTGLKKYRELFESTLVVIISVLLLAGFVTTSDLFLARIVGILTGGSLK
jgi:preprotein translocase subunit SecE